MTDPHDGPHDPQAQKFPFGHVVATPGALKHLTQTQCADLLRRHGQLDPGTLGAQGVEGNAMSLCEGFRILSAYEVDGVAYWVITKADRSATTILLPDEYDRIDNGAG